MSYSNMFLSDFVPIFHAILKEKQIAPEKLELEVIDEEPDSHRVFEPADVLDVLKQLATDLNFLTIYTDRPAYFTTFAGTMYEENGLVINFFPKRLASGERIFLKKDRDNADLVNSEMKKRSRQRLILDFEWEGNCYQPHGNYIPVHKKPWKIAENLDIIVPFSYNTVIVKSIQMVRKRPRRDRFEEAFYKNEIQ